MTLCPYRFIVSLLVVMWSICFIASIAGSATKQGQVAFVSRPFGYRAPEWWWVVNSCLVASLLIAPGIISGSLARFIGEQLNECEAKPTHSHNTAKRFEIRASDGSKNSRAMSEH